MHTVCAPFASRLCPFRWRHLESAVEICAVESCGLCQVYKGKWTAPPGTARRMFYLFCVVNNLSFIFTQWQDQRPPEGSRSTSTGWRTWALARENNCAFPFVFHAVTCVFDTAPVRCVLPVCCVRYLSQTELAVINKAQQHHVTNFCSVQCALTVVLRKTKPACHER